MDETGDKLKKRRPRQDAPSIRLYPKQDKSLEINSLKNRTIYAMFVLRRLQFSLTWFLSRSRDVSM